MSFEIFAPAHTIVCQMTTEEFIREFEHTGDAGIEVEAPSRADLFACAAIGVARIMVAPDGIEPRETHTITVFGDNDEDLMHDALSDALNLFLCDGFIWRDATVEEASGHHRAEAHRRAIRSHSPC